MDSEILRQIKDDYLNFDISIQSFGGESPASPIADLPVGSDNDEESSAPGKESKDQSSQKSSGKGSHKSDTPALDKYGYDMTKAAAEGRLDPVVGRENEIERLAQILSRRKRTIRS